MSSTDPTAIVAPRIGRRRLLQTAVLGLGALVAAFFGRRFLVRSGTLDGWVIRWRLSYLTIDGGALDAFLRDHLAAHRPNSPNPLHLLFLLSTDFFQNGADPSRPPKYTSYFNPYVSPCGNPFVRSR